MAGDIVTKAAVSVTEMARMVGLSRARFYQLVKQGTFPPADQDAARTARATSRRSSARFSKLGGETAASMASRSCSTADATTPGRRGQRPARPAARSKDVVKKYTDLIDGLAALNVTVTVAQVEPVVKEVFPNGTDGHGPRRGHPGRLPADSASEPRRISRGDRSQYRSSSADSLSTSWQHLGDKP